MHQNSLLSIEDICEELGLKPQFLLGLSANTIGLYRTFDLPKRSGGVRTISVPHDRLKGVQRIILDNLISKQEMPEHVHGCVKGRSIVTNARGHVNKPLVINIDLKNFFGSISFANVFRIFEKQFNCDPVAAETLARLTTYGNFLPQGAPTSPMLANFAALDLDRELMQICARSSKNYSFHYTRYVDDITISGGVDLLFLLGEFYSAIKRNGFRANPRKLSLARPSTRQKVTGVTVNQKLAPPKKLVRKLRQQLYYCSKFGIEDHCRRNNIECHDFVTEVRGMIGYVRMTQPLLADTFELELFEAERSLTSIMTAERSKMVLLTHAIEFGKIVRFNYEQSFCRAAPSEIDVDDDGSISVRAFQLSPEQVWRTYKASLISDLEPEGAVP